MISTGVTGGFLHWGAFASITVKKASSRLATQSARLFFAVDTFWDQLNIVKLIADWHGLSSASTDLRFRSFLERDEELEVGCVNGVQATPVKHVSEAGTWRCGEIRGDTWQNSGFRPRQNLKMHKTFINLLSFVLVWILSFESSVLQDEDMHFMHADFVPPCGMTGYFDLDWAWSRC